MENPYSPPEQPLTDAHQLQYQERAPLASTGKRFLNYLIDKVVQVGLAFLLGAVLGILMNPEDLEVVLDDKIINFGIGYALTFVYYMVMESTCGRTLGKLVTGTKVLSEAYQTPSLGQILGRSLSRLIPFEPLSILDSSTKMWHDQLSNTITVDVRAKPLPPLHSYVPGQKPLIIKHPKRPLSPNSPIPQPKQDSGADPEV